MKNIFNNQVVRMVREEVNDLRKKNKDTRSDQEISPSQPTFYHCPSSSSSNTDSSYSHTATQQLDIHKDRQTLVGKIEATTTHLGHFVEDAVVSVTNKFNSAVTVGRNARELIQNGAVIQLISKHSSHLLQVVMSSSGSLIFDANGPANAFNTYFNVEEGEKGRFRFHNNCNYLAFQDKHPCIITLPPGPKNNVNIDFRIHDILGSSELVAFESCAYKNCFISITADGHLKTSHIKDKNVEAQFSIIPVPVHQPPTFPHQTQPYHMNPYDNHLHNSENPYMPPHPSMYHQQSPTTSLNSPMYDVQPSAPPPSYAESTSSSLYPKFN
ncbi:hypothetical protein I4U23_007176 [Adineta vaga]|nr:hypothetical protein I4U23_007176 [Adineta vaga]